MFSRLVKLCFALTEQCLQTGDIFLCQTKSMVFCFFTSSDFKTQFACLLCKLVEKLFLFTLSFFSEFLRFHNFILE